MTPSLGPADIRETIVRIVSETIGESVTPETDLRSLDLPSLQVMRIVSRFEDTFGIRVPALLLFEADTVEDLAIGVARSKLDTTVPRARPPIRALPRRRQLSSTDSELARS